MPPPLCLSFLFLFVVYTASWSGGRGDLPLYQLEQKFELFRCSPCGANDFLISDLDVPFRSALRICLQLKL